MRRSLLICAALLILVSSLVGEELIHYRLGARMVVYDAEAAADALIGWLEESGGYFLNRSGTGVEARIPAERVHDVAGVLEELSEDLLDYTLEAEDLTRDLARARASLSSREEVLARNLAFLDDADFTSTLAIEREVMQLIEEIELLRGTIARLENRARFAALDIRLKSEGVQPTGAAESSFAWINSFDFYRFMDDRPVDRALPWLPRFGTPDSAPEGFSVYRRSVLYRAISPEGVKIRHRVVKPEPRMELSFWRTALERHLESAGYQARGGIQALTLDGSEGIRGSWLVPYGGEEYLFTVVLAARGAKIEIFETGGPLEAADFRRAAIESWQDSILR